MKGLMTLPEFRTIVSQSRVLSSEQKEFLLEDPTTLPEIYRSEVIRLLTAFDERSKVREAYLSKKLTRLYEEFERSVLAGKMDENEKRALIQKAKTQMDQFFPSASA